MNPNTQHFPESYSPEAAFRARIANRSRIQRLTPVPEMYQDMVTIEEYNRFLSDRYYEWHSLASVLTLEEWIKNNKNKEG